MKIYTIKDEQGNLYPEAILKTPVIAKAVQDGEIVEVDYGLDAINQYIKKSKGEDYTLAICELHEIKN